MIGQEENVSSVNSCGWIRCCQKSYIPFEAGMTTSGFLMHTYKSVCMGLGVGTLGFTGCPDDGTGGSLGSVNSYGWILCFQRCQRLDCGQCEWILMEEYAAVRGLIVGNVKSYPWIITLLSQVRLWAVWNHMDEHAAVRGYIVGRVNSYEWILCCQRS